MSVGRRVESFSTYRRSIIIAHTITAMSGNFSRKHTRVPMATSIYRLYTVRSSPKEKLGKIKLFKRMKTQHTSENDGKMRKY